MAEGVGIEPTHGCYPVYGLAIRCITILPALRRRLSFYRKIAPPSTLKRTDGEKYPHQSRCSNASDKCEETRSASLIRFSGSRKIDSRNF